MPMKKSKIKIVASSSVFKIAKIIKAGKEDYNSLIGISNILSDHYGKKAVLTNETIEKYFNKDGCLPFVAIYREEMVGYIIGVPIEELSQEPWARKDINYGEKNTIYTYAYVIKKEYQGNGYAKMLKKVFISWISKQEQIHYITGHVKKGIAKNFTGNIQSLGEIKNWQGTGITFEYYRRTL